MRIPKGRIRAFVLLQKQGLFHGCWIAHRFHGGVLLEKRCVRFENTRTPLAMVLRLAGGIALYYILNTVLKLPFPKVLLFDDSTAALMICCARYAIIAFVGFGIYPMLFRYGKRAK